MLKPAAGKRRSLQSAKATRDPADVLASWAQKSDPVLLDVRSRRSLFEVDGVGWTAITRGLARDCCAQGEDLRGIEGEGVRVCAQRGSL